MSLHYYGCGVDRQLSLRTMSRYDVVKVTGLYLPITNSLKNR